MRAIVIAIVAAIAILAGGVIWFALKTMLPEDDAAFVAGEGGGAVVDSGARIRIVELEVQLDALREDIAGLRRELAALSGEIGRLTPSAPREETYYDDGVNRIEGDYAALVLIPDRRTLNTGLTVPSPAFLEDFLGRPRATLSDACQGMTNPDLKALLKTEQVGPIRVRLLAPVIESLARVFEEVRATDPDLYDRIDTAGSLCVRQIRGSSGRTSSHSFGTAVDINIDGQLDAFGDGKTQLGLLVMADFFLEEGWVWGAGWGREDSMHFEVSRESLEALRADGRL